MLRNHGLRCAAVVAVALVLAGPVAPAHAAGRTATGSSLKAGAAALWAWVKTTLSLGPAAQMACDKGGYIDPNGGCRTAAAASPSGGGTTATDSDKGIYIDPNGG